MDLVDFSLSESAGGTSLLTILSATGSSVKFRFNLKNLNGVSLSSSRYYSLSPGTWDVDKMWNNMASDSDGDAYMSIDFTSGSGNYIARFSKYGNLDEPTASVPK